MKKILSIMLAVILLMININTAFPASAAVDNSRYIPKVVGTKNGNKLIFNPEIAKIAREMSTDAYGVKKGSIPDNLAKTMNKEGFIDLKQNYHSGNVIDDLLLANNFVVGVKNFEVNGEKKHVLAIAFKGSKDIGDWWVDGTPILMPSYEGFHIGFYTAASDAHNTVLHNMTFKIGDGKSITYDEYIRYAATTDDYYIFVTGHSLGGAVANIYVGEFLAKEGIRDNAMCYTFATPLICSKKNAEQNKSRNIFNIINTADNVPNVGYSNGTRLGIDLKGTEEVYKIDPLLYNHKIEGAYEKVTKQVINNIDSQYKYTTSFYEKWNNDTNKGNGKHIHNYYYDDGKCYCGEKKGLKQQTDEQSTLKINLTKYPVQHTQGKNFGLRGTISSNYSIKKIYGYIKQNGNVIQSTEDSPNAKSVDVSEKRLNNNLIFQTLTPGSYTLEVQAIDASGNSIRVSKNFTVVGEVVKAESTLSINLEKYPVSIIAGNGFGLRGSVNSNYNISLVRGYVIDSTGKTWLSSKDTPHSRSMNIKEARLNNDLIFNDLPAGSYTLRVVATDSSGKTIETTKNFRVESSAKNNDSTLSINLERYPVTLDVNTAYGLRGSITSNYNISIVRGYVTNANGQTVLSSTDTPNSTYMDIQPSRLNWDLVFNKLSAGSYTMRVVAVDYSGRTIEVSKNFTVKAKAAYVDNTANGNGVAGTVNIPSSWENLSIRTGPSTSYDVIGSMNQGAKCTVYPNKTVNGWYYVNYNGLWGYASGNQINLNTSSSNTQATNTRTGIINIPSDWTDLSIRTGPSTGYQIVGGMPHGARCTVYPDKASNGWYYVEYKGIRGYAAGNRINLQ
ncbi:MAG: SH3 domain-containing protein [Clostridia bacterium]|nr:SH3 domain-containing protein [Clostridia bacterium]